MVLLYHMLCFAITKNNDIIYLCDYKIIIILYPRKILTYIFSFENFVIRFNLLIIKNAYSYPYNGETFWVKSIYRLTILHL